MCEVEECCLEGYKMLDSRKWELSRVRPTPAHIRLPSELTSDHIQCYYGMLTLSEYTKHTNYCVHLYLFSSEGQLLCSNNLCLTEPHSPVTFQN